MTTIRLVYCVRPTWQHRDLDRRTGWRGPRLIRRWVFVDVHPAEPWESGQFTLGYGYGHQHWRPRLDRVQNPGRIDRLLAKVPHWKVPR